MRRPAVLAVEANALVLFQHGGAGVADHAVALHAVPDRVGLAEVEGVQRDRTLQVTRADDHHVLGPALRHALQDRVDEGPVRVQYGHALAAADVVGDHLQHQRGLARAGLPDDVHVLEALRLVDAHLGLASTHVGETE